MKLPRSINIRHSSDSVIANTAEAKRNDHNRLVVPVYSGFFSSLTDNVMCTNVMFDSLKKEIDASISQYSTRENIVLTVYDSSSVDNDVRESVLVGFKKYISRYKKKVISDLKFQSLIFLSLFIVGVLLEFLLYEVLTGVISEWIANTLDIFAWVFIWQFAAYMTFEFAKEIKTIKRLSQIMQIEYVFRHWE